MKLLLLAGTTEARRMAERLAADATHTAIASLAGATRAPKPLALATRTGGFGGRDAQKKWMQNNNIEAVIDATHPFADAISRRTQSLCAAMGLGYLRLERPGWTAQPGDRWSWVNSTEEAAAALPAGATVFLATGRQSLPAFFARNDVTLYLRRIDPAPFPRERGGYVVGPPGANEGQEASLFRRLKVDLLVAKDSGGPARAKLDAARALGLEVLMIRRPPPVPGERVQTVAAVLDWLERQS